jgi:hypothetical protein
MCLDFCRATLKTAYRDRWRESDKRLQIVPARGTRAEAALRYPEAPADNSDAIQYENNERNEEDGSKYAAADVHMGLQ